MEEFTGFRGTWPEVIGKVLVVAVVQLSIGKLELSSRIEIATLANTQENVDLITSDFRTYLVIASLWALGTTLLMYTMHAMRAAIINLIANILIMIWILWRRYPILTKTAKKYNLKVPSII